MTFFAPYLASPSVATPRRVNWTPALAALFCFALAATTPALLGDGDTFWHIAAGQWIIDHRAVPQADPFSFTMAGTAWTAHEWLSEVLMAAAFRAAGWSGVVLLAAAAFAATAFLFARRLAVDLAGPALIALTTMGLGLLLGSLLARPHLLALPLLTAWAAGLVAARDEDRAPSLALLPVMALWSNMHGGFLFGLALIGPFALEALLEAPAPRRLAVFRDWALFGLLALGAALVNPLGIEALLFPLRLMGMKSLAGVAEWQPETFDHFGATELELLALLGFAVLRPMRLTLLRALLLVGLVHLALHHSRHAMLLGLVAPMILARPMAVAIEQDRPAPARFSAREWAGVVALFLVCCGLRLALPVQRADGPMAPLSALAALPPEIRVKPVLNHYGFGGALIFAGVKPYIDGRTDLFGDAFLDDYDRIAAGEAKALDAALARWNIAWTIFPPNTAFVHTMDTKPGWKRLYGDSSAVVHLRENSSAARP